MHLKFLTLFLLSILLLDCTKAPADLTNAKDSHALKATEQTEPRVHLPNTLVHELPSAFIKTTYDIHIFLFGQLQGVAKNIPCLFVLDAEVNQKRTYQRVEVCV